MQAKPPPLVLWKVLEVREVKRQIIPLLPAHINSETEAQLKKLISTNQVKTKFKTGPLGIEVIMRLQYQVRLVAGMAWTHSAE